MMARMRLDEKLAANLPPDHAERTARMLLQRLSQEGGTERPSAPPPSPPEQGDASEGAWSWFSGRKTSRGSGRHGRLMFNVFTMAGHQTCSWEE
jgi:hypothetical protein